MKVAWTASAIALLLACSTACAQQQYFIHPGTAVVDGVIATGEWVNANWVVMDKVYHGTPIDLTNAAWAALWDGEENAIYVVVKGTDSDHVLHQHTAWNGQDAIELYIDARNGDAQNYALGDRPYELAQQYVVGFDQWSTSVWAVLGGGDELPSNALPAVAFGVVSNDYVYEFKLHPYENFDYSNVAASTMVDLFPGRTVGLDVVMNTRTAGGIFGMLCENTDGSKFNKADRMRDFFLVGPRGTRIYIAALGRRRLVQEVWP